MLKRHCETVGRNYNSIRRTASALCVIADTDKEALAQLPEMAKARLGGQINTALVGSPETIRKRLAAYEAADVQELVLLLPVHGTARPAMIRRFAKEFLSRQR